MARVLLFTCKTCHAFPQQISQDIPGTSWKRRQLIKKEGGVSQVFGIAFLKMPLLWGSVVPERDWDMI